MTDLNQLVEVGARALAKHPDSSWDDYEWEDMPSHVQMLFWGIIYLTPETD